MLLCIEEMRCFSFFRKGDWRMLAPPRRVASHRRQRKPLLLPPTGVRAEEALALVVLVASGPARESPLLF